ncbi:hypothetical protein [Jiangella asiatica]|uniref:DUF624 domain-containing protein n=1 Tax=Jiangella asiatica TaxID=2530372 RepID=A0A4R5DQ75_9ACTN|nr:hypothetical protein [Jiangella asiatica]TDE14330.1 hypothetical protein E1269_04020 [Jiangella asiatica]
MTHLLAVDGPLYRVLATWTAFVRASAVWLLLCLPVVTAPAATVVLLRTMRSIVSGAPAMSVRECWHATVRALFPALRLAAVLTAGSFVVVTAVIGPSPGGEWDGVLPLVIIPVAAMWALASTWSFAVLEEREDGAWNALRYAYLRVVRRPDLAVGAVLGTTTVLVIGVAVPSGVWIPYWLTAPALCALIVTITSRRAGVSARATNAVPIEEDHHG